MAFTRRNVWELGKDWADPILWYARGVKAMKARPLKEPTSWRFFGAIHGIEEALWRRLGYLSSKDKLPSKTVVRQYWKQCQHGSWYFLPWHRGYLLAFEAVVRDAVIGLGGPRDWALPYWNYAKPDQDGLPPAFASADWPDGRGDNPLFVKQRYGPHNDGNVFVPPKRINLRALGDPDFTGTAKGGSPGFGGVNTGFSHGGEVHGRLETQPHDAVHVLVGGGTNRKPSLMSDPDTAGLDPIFWLHHANIDRLWEVWRENPPSHADPSNAKWVRGPHSVGERAFIMPMPGGRHLTYTPGQMSNLAKLDYDYDDVSPPEGTPQPLARLQRLGATAAAAQTLVRRTAVAGRKTVELLGANKQSLRLTGSEAKDAVVLDSAVQQKLTASLRSAATAAAAPDRVFLNLEHVRGLHSGTVFDVYINVPEGADPAQYPDNLAGTIGLFGVRKATVTDDKNAGTGLTFVIEISHIIDALHLSGALNAGQLHVRLVPVTPVPEAAKISIGHIKVYRQSG